MVTKHPIVKRTARWFLAVLMVSVGLAHFLVTEEFVRMMPAVLPLHRELVWISGFFEILGGVGLLIERTRRWCNCAARRGGSIASRQSIRFWPKRSKRWIAR